VAAQQRWQRGSEPTFLEWACKLLRLPPPDSPPRQHALAGMADDPTAVPVLIQLLADADGGVREAALETVARLGPRGRPAASVVRPLVQEGPLAQRLKAAQTLWALTEEPGAVLPTLAEAFQDPATTLDAAEALQPLGPAAAPLLPTILGAMGDPNRPHFQAAFRALYHLGPAAAPAVPRLVEMLQAEGAGSRQQGLVLMTLQELGPVAREAAPAVRPLLQPDQPLLYQAVAALMQIEPANPANLDLVVTLLRSPRGELRTTVVNALGTTTAHAVLPVLLAMLQDPAEELWDQAAQAMAQIDPAERPFVIARLTAELENPHRRIGAARALAGMGAGARAALPDLHALHQRSSGDVRAALAQAIHQIEPRDPGPPWLGFLTLAAVAALVAALSWSIRRRRLPRRSGPPPSPITLQRQGAEP
jgi:HEAT repeat protein